MRWGASFGGISGQPGLWSGNVQSEHNSQYLFDPYTFSHITHGILLYGLLWLVAGRLPGRVRLLIAVGIECAWEVIENTDYVIQRYRAEPHRRSIRQQSFDRMIELGKPFK